MHIWLAVRGEDWAIESIWGPVFFLWRGHGPERLVIDTSTMDWEAHCDEAVALLNGLDTP